LGVGFVLGGGLLGAAIGFLASFILGPEVIPQLLGLGYGFIAGAALSVSYLAWVVGTGRCTTCPPGVSAFCVTVWFFRPVPGAPPIPIPPFLTPAAASCTIIPAGCP
jgi:hypothetical protein